MLLKFGAVLSIICGFLMAFYTWTHLLQCIVFVRSFLRLLKLRKLGVCKLYLSRGGSTRCHGVLEHGLNLHRNILLRRILHICHKKSLDPHGSDSGFTTIGNIYQINHICQSPESDWKISKDVWDLNCSNNISEAHTRDEILGKCTCCMNIHNFGRNWQHPNIWILKLNLHASQLSLTLRIQHQYKYHLFEASISKPSVTVLKSPH